MTFDAGDSSRKEDRAPGAILVALQFALVIAIAWPSANAAWSGPGAALVLAGVLLGIATLSVNRPGNFNIRPQLKPSAKLVMAGPYRYVRHPMYLALMLLMGGIACFHAAWMQWLALCFLAAVLYAKTVLEERSLRSAFPEYGEYARSTGRFLPRLILRSSRRP